MHTEQTFEFLRCLREMMHGADMRSRRLLRELGLSSTQAGMLHQLMAAYSVSPPTFKRDRREMGPLKGFPRQPAIHSSHSV